MVDTLPRVLAFVRALRERRATRRVLLPFGHALFDDALPLVYYLNVAVVGPGARPSFGELVETVERIQGAAGLAHRKIATDDEALANALAPGLRSLGWAWQRLLVMRWVGAVPPGGAASLVSRRRLEPVWADELRAAGEAQGEGEIRQLVEARALTERTVPTSFVAAVDHGAVAGSCELYSTGGVGQIENVVTLPAFRGRGHGSAVVRRAVAESGRLGNDVHFLLADDGDWPKEWYGRLGFESVGRIHEFLRRPPVAQRPAAT